MYGFFHTHMDYRKDKQTAIETIRRAYKLGYNFFDTAECYNWSKCRWNNFSIMKNIVGESIKRSSEIK